MLLSDAPVPGRSRTLCVLAFITQPSSAGCGERARMRDGDAVPTGLTPCCEIGRDHEDSFGYEVSPNARVMISCLRICLIAFVIFCVVFSVGLTVVICSNDNEARFQLQGTS